MARAAGIEIGKVTASDAVEKRDVLLEELLLACFLVILLQRGVFAVSPSLLLILNGGKGSGLEKN